MSVMCPKYTVFCGQIKEEFRRRGLSSRAQFAEARELQEEFQEVFAEQMVSSAHKKFYAIFIREPSYES